MTTPSRNLPIRRRSLLLTGGACLATLGVGRASAERPDGMAWRAWTRAFLEPDGRVVDHLQGRASHSEGQGYGMLLAQAEGDRDAFGRMESWAARKLATRADALMAWRWLPDEGVGEMTNATDGDLFRAWALWRATRQSGWSEFAGRAEPIVHDIAERCLAKDPRTADEPLLVPAANSPRGPGGVLFNPSYIMPRALRELGMAFDRPELIRAADHGETVLAELTEGGLVPDWTFVTEEGFRNPVEYSSRHGYDAIRVPLFLVWSGRASHPAVEQSAALHARTEGEVPVVVERDGRVLQRSGYSGYRALRALLTCAEPPALSDPESYYPATLGLLAEVARREGQSCQAK